MKSTSIEAYDLPDRVAQYDADMEIMHPLRWKMIDVALDVIPFAHDAGLKVLDLGVGTGAFSKRLLERFPKARVVAVDGAASMFGLAKARLGALADRVDWVLSDFRGLSEALLAGGSYDAVISSYALHHLNAEEKGAVLAKTVRAIRPGGWLLNADLVTAQAPEVERRIQELRVQGIVARAPDSDERFRSAERTRQFLDDLEAAEQDRPQTLDTDLRLLREAGLLNAEVFWKEHREAVMGGSRTTVPR